MEIDHTWRPHISRSVKEANNLEGNQRSWRENGKMGEEKSLGLDGNLCRQRFATANNWPPVDLEYRRLVLKNLAIQY